MIYTVRSGGRPIGTTDLGFVYRMHRTRVGWFLPNEEGERLMSVVTARHVALAAFGRSVPRGADGRSLDGRQKETPELAALRDAMEHESALVVTLQRPDGSIVPTASIGFQDTEQLLMRAHESEEEEARRPWTPEHERAELELGALAEELDAENGDDDDDDGWTSEPEPDWPHYQIIVELQNERDVP